MYIPPAATVSTSNITPLSFFADDGSEDSRQQKWSSLIGVTTAIIGNVLISFALNTQRYAHLRLSREREEKQRRQTRHRKKGSYGTQQEDIAEERAEENAKAEAGRGSLESGGSDEAGETQPLIPRLDHDGDRKGKNEEDTEDDDAGSIKEKSYLRSPIWWAGITMMVLGEAGNFLAYGFAPASIVSPLGVVALVSNCLVAPLLLHERFRWRDALGVIIAVGGCVTVVLSASDSNPKLGPDEIWDLISQWEFETYLGITIFLIIALAVASNKFGERTILIDLGLVGLFGGYTALSTKGVASLLSNTIWRVVTFPITYLLVAVLVFTAIMQIKYVNRALQRFNSTMVIPTQFVLFTISVIVGSAILYRDFERTTPEDAGKFVGGCALTFLGVWCITSGRNDGDSQGDEEFSLNEGDEEDEIDLLDEEDEQQPEVREHEGRQSAFITPSSSKTASRLTPGGDRDDQALASSSYKSSYFTPQTHSYEPLPPATQAAIHSSSTSDLPADNPSAPGSTAVAARNLQPPPFHATTSAPIVPTTGEPNGNTTMTASPARPRTPLRRGITHAEGSPSHSPVTPRRQQNNQHLDPNAAAEQRQRLLNRHSVAGFLPAPYTSPLSSSLSAIVADSLRNTDSSTGSPLRRRSTKFRRKATGEVTMPGGGTSASGAGAKRHSIASGELSPEREGSGGRPVEGRLRSLSETLGEAFGVGGGNATGTVRGKGRKNGGTGDQRRGENVPEGEEGGGGASGS